MDAEYCTIKTFNKDFDRNANLKLKALISCTVAFFTAFGIFHSFAYGFLASSTVLLIYVLFSNLSE
jgi:hypothetical protein